LRHVVNLNLGEKMYDISAEAYRSVNGLEYRSMDMVSAYAGDVVRDGVAGTARRPNPPTSYRVYRLCG
jgi:hypothetical protein